MTTTRKLVPGVYCAQPCFFKSDEELDLDAFVKHLVYVAKAGCYPVISGSMGEAVHLSSAERVALVKAARKGLDNAGLPDVGLLVGAGGSSTRRTIELVQEAAEAGADQVMVILDGYYSGILKANPKAVEDHFVEVANASPVPVMLYNFPAVTGGLDLGHELVEAVARRASNTCGIKLTCASIGKLTRLAAVTKSSRFLDEHPRKDVNAPFLLLDGQIDILLASVPVGADGCIGGVPNFAPLACAKLWQLTQQELTGESLREAQELQGIIARADFYASAAGIPGMKYLLGKMFGYGKAPRRPLPVYSDSMGERFEADLKEILDLEASLRKAIV